ncbi:hypothetical protein C0J52_23056 [Blattella germanica]|nr:hypothetical protein C0J52_23056 [Blattella germanica]
MKCFYWLAEFKFLIAVQRRFRQEYGANAPDRHTIMKWYNHQLLETGSLFRKKVSGKNQQLELKMLGKHFSVAQGNQFDGPVYSWVFRRFICSK